MDGEHVLIRPTGPLDVDATEAMTDALNAAVAAGSVAVVDLDHSSDFSADPPYVTVPSPPLDTEQSPVAVTTEAGFIRLDSASSCWTVDLRAHRFCRSQAVVDRRFVPADHWTGLRRLWVSSTALTALTSPGAFVSARRFRSAAEKFPNDESPRA